PTGPTGPEGPPGTTIHSELEYLDSDDHKQYLLVDGTRAMSGDLDMDGYSIVKNNSVTFVTEYDNGSSGSSINIDWSNGQKQRITLTDNSVTLTFTAPSGPGNFLLKVIQDGSGNREISTFPSNSFAPNGSFTLSSGANDVDICAIYYDGTNYYWTIANNFEAI